MAMIAPMGDDKANPMDDLKQGLGLLFRAAKGAVDRLPTENLESVAKDAVKEVARAFENIGHEVEKVIHPGGPPEPPPADEARSESPASGKASEPPADPAEPEAPRGPRVGP